MTTMLEKAARALADHFGCEWETMRAADRETMRGYARAVLLAIREPDTTDDDIASVHRGNTLSWDCDAEGVRFIRAAMIDAILAGETET